MKSYKTFLVLSLLVALALSSCSGLPKTSTGGCVTSCAGGGNALINMTVTMTPSTKFSVLRFAALANAIGVTNAAGAFTGEIGARTFPPSDGYRLQTDSQFISKSNIAGDNYKSVTVTIGGDQGVPIVTGVFANTSTSTVLGCPVSAFACAAGSVSCPPPSGGALSLCLLPVDTNPVAVTVPLIFTVIPGQNMGVDVNLNLDIAMTPQKVDFTLPGAVTVSLLPRAGQAAGSLDSLEDYLGSVNSTTGGNIVTVDDRPVQEPRDFTTSSSTTFTDSSQTTCVTPNFACAASSQTVSVDALIKSDGFTFPATLVDYLDKASNPHQVEGIVTSVSTTPGQFQMLVIHFLGGQLDPNNNIFPGDLVTVSLNANPTIGIDTKNLTVGNTGFSSESDIIVGQVIMARILQQTGTFPNVTFHCDRAILRYSHFNGTVGTVSGNNFTLTLATLPGFLGLTGTDPTVMTQPGATTFDGLNGMPSTGDKVSVRALFLNPAHGSPFFIAAKVRKNL